MYNVEELESVQVLKIWASEIQGSFAYFYLPLHLTTLGRLFPLFCLTVPV